MYGVRFYQDTIQVQEGNKVDLEAQGYEAFETKGEAETRGVNLEYRALRREFNAMTLAELDSERAKELERRIWGRYANYDGCDYVPGDNIKRRKKSSAVIAGLFCYTGYADVMTGRFKLLGFFLKQITASLHARAPSSQW